MGKDQPCIAIVDDDQDVLRSLERLFRFHGLATHTFSSAESLLEQVSRLRPACILADVALPGLDGLELQEVLADADFDFPIVFVTALDDVRTSVRAMRHGAVDFIQKPFAENELMDAVERALARARLDSADQEAAELFSSRLASLTAREHHVLELVVHGLMNKQIAAELAIAEKTVKIHRSHIMQKMAVRSVAELARLTERFGVRRR
jgi:FixJ family two-component response regulator